MDLASSTEVATAEYAVVSGPHSGAVASFPTAFLPPLVAQSTHALPPVMPWEVELSGETVPPLLSPAPSSRQPAIHVLPEPSAWSYLEPETDLMETFFTQLPEPVSTNRFSGPSIDALGL